MKITWIGQAGLLIKTCGKTIIVDPYLSDYAGSLNPTKHRRTPLDKSFLDITPDVLVFISSNTAYRSIPNRAAYCASKGGINALVKALALDLGRFGIRCNAVLPGTIKTERWKSMGNKQIVNGELTPIGDISDYQDIANAAYFLGTDLSKNITGVELPVDGGMSCQLYPELLTTLKREKLASQQ